LLGRTHVTHQILPAADVEAAISTVKFLRHWDMERINLGSPSPRENELPVPPLEISIIKVARLPPPNDLPNASFQSILERRRSRRTFGGISINQLSTLLWFSANTKHREFGPNGVTWQLKPSPSAGGKHPIQILVFSPDGQLSIYDSVRHSLGLISTCSTNYLEFQNSIGNVVDVQLGTVIWFAAHFDLTMAKYKNGESLVWRDSGALSQTLNLVSESMNLNFCQLGISGEPSISALLQNQGLEGVGGCIVGAKQQN